MLSPGQWHKSVPKERLANLKFRLGLLDAARRHGKLGRKAIHIACREDLFFYINCFIWQYNPRKKGSEVGPFITWDFQDEALRVMLDCIEDDEDLLLEKSREMGASWLVLIVFEWLWHFHGWKKFLMISRNEKAVEAEDPDSLFWKIDFMHRYIPDWLMPKFKRVKLFFGNDNGSTITGQASTGKAGVGGRATAMGIDEFSQIEEDYEVLHRTSDTTGCRIFNGTHLGTDTAFYELAQRVDMKKLVMHWTMHPDKNKGLYRYDQEKNKIEVLDKSFDFPEDYRFVMDGSPTGGPFPGIRSPWYDKECRRKGSARAIAQDLDIDPKGSVSQFFDRLLIRQLQALHAVAPYWEGDLHHDPETGRPKELRPRKGGPLKLWLQLDHRGLPAEGTYAFGADIAAGTGATPSCLSGVKVKTGEKVLEYVNPYIPPDKFATLAVAICWLFKNADGDGPLFAWEQQGPGAVFGNHVVELGYRNVYYRVNEFELNPEASEKPGWYPAPNNKRLLLEEYRAALQSRHFLNRSHEALEECLAFRYDKRGHVEHGGQGSGADPSGAQVNHGDRVIADALAYKMMKSLGVEVKQRQEERAPVLSLAWRRELSERQEVDEESA